MAEGLSGMAYGKSSSGGDKKSSSSLEDEHLTDAFDAQSKGDRRAFVASMKAAIEACVQREMGGDYDKESPSEDAGESGEE